VLERRASLFERSDQILDRLGFPDRLCWKVDVKSPFDAQDQFGTGEAVDPEIALDAAGRLDRNKPAALGMELPNKIAH
jgi:hypothetical protein